MVALVTTLTLAVACTPSTPPVPESVMVAQPTATVGVFLPRVELSEAAPLAVDALPTVRAAAIPTTSQMSADSAVVSPEAPLQLESVSADPVPPAPVSPPVTTYVVQPGDTLLGLALDFGVPMAAIQLSNNLGAETIVRIDQLLKVPQEAMWDEASPFWVVHQVVSGETLSELAVRFGLDLHTLLDANGLSDADLIYVGQSLILPLQGPMDGLLAQAPSAPAVQVLEMAPTSSPDEVPADALVSGDVAAVDVSEETAGVEPAAAPVLVPAAPQAPADAAALAGEIFRLLNEQRAAYGLPPLAWHGTLAYAAQLHADDCYARGWCGHTGSDGSTYKERIIRAGYDPVRWSECWAWYATPEMAVAMWMDEVPPNDPHRRTILSDYLTEVGVGVVPGNGHGYYFIADFGASQ